MKEIESSIAKLSKLNDVNFTKAMDFIDALLLTQDFSAETKAEDTAWEQLKASRTQSSDPSLVSIPTAEDLDALADSIFSRCTEAYSKSVG